MRVIKALNHNMVLARDDSGSELICQGKGIGFQKRSGDLIDQNRVERCFFPANQDESAHFQQLFSEIPDEFWAIAEKVVAYGRKRYSIRVSQKVILPLCDHMAGSVERYKQGVALENPMIWDIKRIYPKEFKVGMYALDLLKEKYGISMKEDEAGFLAYHFVNAELGNMNVVSPDTMARLVGSIVDLVEQAFQLKLNEEDWNYQRFLTHLKFFVARIVTKQFYQDVEDNDLYQELRERYPHVYRCVEHIGKFISRDFQYDISQEEKLYLMIHIERVIRSSKRSGG